MLVQYFGIGGSVSTSTTSSNFNVTTSWQRFSATLSLPSLSGKTIGANDNYFSIRPIYLLSSAATTIDIWGVQLEAGSVATAFTTASGGSPQAELAMCQRYYYRQGGLSLYQAFTPNSPALSTTSVYFGIPVPVTMRVVPSAIDYATLEVIDGVNAAVAVTTANIITATASNSIIQMSATVASGLTQYRSYYLRASNSTSAYIGFSAEL